MKALIGHTGYVGSSLKRQTAFDAMFRSNDIEQIAGQRFDLVVCAGVPAQKWIAERDPAGDLANIQRLADQLVTIEATHFVLISTVDVYADCRGCSEDDSPDPASASHYGRNRLWLERFVADRFTHHTIIRLPGLVGPGLRKNAIFDLLNSNGLDQIDARGSFQFYPMVNLWADIQTAIGAGISLLHFACAPLTIAQVAREAFGKDFANRLDRPPASYDLHSRHAQAFGGSGRYLYDARASLMAIRAYAQSEPLSKPLA